MTLTENRDAALAAQASALATLNSANEMVTKANEDVVAAAQALSALQPHIDLIDRIEKALADGDTIAMGDTSSAYHALRNEVLPAIAKLRALFNI